MCVKIFTAKEAKKLADKTVKEGEELTHDKDPWVVSWKSRITHAVSDSSKKGRYRCIWKITSIPYNGEELIECLTAWLESFGFKVESHK